MAMSRIRKRDDKPAALDHVLYEMQMLILALLALSRPNLSPADASGWLEVFAIHARNLNEFFGPKNPGDDYMRPDHFVPWTYAYQFDGDLKGRASSQIAHLTYSRERPEEKTRWAFETYFTALRIPSMEFLAAVAQVESLMAYQDNRGRTQWLLAAFPGVSFQRVEHNANIA
jgi:hypothetical protein